MFYGIKAQYKTEKRIRLLLLFNCELQNCCKFRVAVYLQCMQFVDGVWWAHSFCNIYIYIYIRVWQKQKRAVVFRTSFALFVRCRNFQFQFKINLQMLMLRKGEKKRRKKVSTHSEYIKCIATRLPFVNKCTEFLSLGLCLIRSCDTPFRTIGISKNFQVCAAVC